MANKTKWSINPNHSEISFKVMHLMLSNVKGIFKEFDARIETKENDFSTANIVLWINISSLETGNIKRDKHLKSAEFFDTKKYKKITFVSDHFEKTGKDDCYNLWGYLTMKGITNPIKFDVNSGGTMNGLNGNGKAEFNIRGKLSRKDWGLSWNTASDTVGIMGSDEVSVNCKLELLQLGKKELALAPAILMMDAK